MPLTLKTAKNRLRQNPNAKLIICDMDSTLTDAFHQPITAELKDHTHEMIDTHVLAIATMRPEYPEEDLRGLELNKKLSPELVFTEELVNETWRDVMESNDTLEKTWFYNGKEVVKDDLSFIKNITREYEQDEEDQGTITITDKKKTYSFQLSKEKLEEIILEQRKILYFIEIMFRLDLHIDIEENPYINNFKIDWNTHVNIPQKTPLENIIFIDARPKHIVEANALGLATIQADSSDVAEGLKRSIEDLSSLLGKEEETVTVKKTSFRREKSGRQNLLTELKRAQDKMLADSNEYLVLNEMIEQVNKDTDELYEEEESENLIIKGETLPSIRNAIGKIQGSISKTHGQNQYVDKINHEVLKPNRFYNYIKAIEIDILNTKWKVSRFGGYTYDFVDMNGKRKKNFKVTTTQMRIIERLKILREQLEATDAKEKQEELCSITLEDIIDNIIRPSARRNNSWLSFFRGRSKAAKQFYSKWADTQVLEHNERIEVIR